MNQLAILPIVIPMLTAIFCLFTHGFLRLQQTIAVVGNIIFVGIAARILYLCSSGQILIIQAGNWPAPYGITIAIDILSAIMTLLGAMMSLVITLYSITSIDRKRKRFFYFPLCNFMMVGVSGSFITGDLFNMYVWFEVMLISSFILMALGGERAQIQGAFKYFTLNIISSTMFLCGLGILYGELGTLNMADLALRLRSIPEPSSGILVGSAILFLVAFAVKAAVWPFFFWLPASYHTPPPAISAFFAGILTKVGVYSLMRAFTLIFIERQKLTLEILLFFGIMSMLCGVLAAASRFEMRQILSFHIVSQIGYMITGLAINTPLAISGAIFYLIHHIIVKTNLFLIAGILHYKDGHSRLRGNGGYYKSSPLLSILFLIAALSLAGLPPLSGFWPKFIVILAALEQQYWWTAIIALITGFLTLFSMTKIWNEIFWKKPPETPDKKIKKSKSLPATLVLPCCLLAICTVTIGLSSGSILKLSDAAAKQLLTPQIYIDAVLTQEYQEKILNTGAKTP